MLFIRDTIRNRNISIDLSIILTMMTKEAKDSILEIQVNAALAGYNPGPLE